MKKIYFLISIIVVFLIPSLVVSTMSTNGANKVNSINSENRTMITEEKIEITSGKYLNLAYQNGKFYSWNQESSQEQIIIGVFNKDDQSYLLDNFGVFWTLDFQIFKFYRVSNSSAIARIKYFKNENNEEYFDQNFILTLNENKTVTIKQTPIISNNVNFIRLDDTHALAYGIGLELIDISNNNVSTLIVPYDKGEFPTMFYLIDANNGIFVAGDQYYYLLNNITSGLIQTKIELITPNSSNNNVVVFNTNNVIIRSDENNLNFVDISNPSNIVINPWKDEAGNAISSKANNFAFILSPETFILNTSATNSGSSYGLPYLVHSTNWNNLVAIPNIASLADLMIINDNTGIFINKNLQAINFTYQSSDDSFVLSILGTLNNFQFINKNLFFGSVGEMNLLLTQETNSFWSLIANVEFTPKNSKTTINFLNLMVNTDTETINYQNTYFSNGTLHFNLTDLSLRSVLIELSSGPIRRLTPVANNVSYDFLNFDNYDVTITLITNTGEQDLKYHVNVARFNNQDLCKIEGTNILSYVGASKKKLYDIKVIDQQSKFTITNFNYNYLQYVELYVYQDASNTVVKNKYILKNNSEIQATKTEYFFGLKVVNLLDETNWTYLGFSKEGLNPMIDFWDTEFGKNLMSQALEHRYLERNLRKMNAQEIIQLKADSKTWQAIAIQGKAIVITVASIFGIALVAIVSAIIFNTILNKKIEIVEVEKNLTPVKDLP